MKSQIKIEEKIKAIVTIRDSARWGEWPEERSIAAESAIMVLRWVLGESDFDV